MTCEAGKYTTVQKSPVWRAKGAAGRKAVPDAADRLSWSVALDDLGGLLPGTRPVGEEEHGHAQLGRHAGVVDGLLEARVPADDQRRPGYNEREHVLGLDGGCARPADAAQNPDGLAESSLRDTTVTLPAGCGAQPVGWRWAGSVLGGPGGGGSATASDRLQGLRRIQPGIRTGCEVEHVHAGAGESLAPG